MNVRKKITTTLFVLIMLMAVFLFAGCHQPNNSNADNNVDGDNQNSSPMTYATHLWLKNREVKEFSKEEDVTVELCFGTNWSKVDVDKRGISYVVDIVAECYSGLRVEKSEPDAEALLWRIEDFYAENYPFSITEDLIYEAQSFNLTLPKTLFVGTDGLIAIKMRHNGLRLSDAVSYRIDGEKIILGQSYDEIYNTNTSQTGKS